MIELSDSINQSISAYMANVYTCLPAIVQSYDAKTKKVNVKPAIRMKFADDEEVSMPAIDSVPVMFPGTKNTVIQFPLNAGDTGAVFFSTRSLEFWLNGSGKETSSGTPRKFSLSDAIFYPGLFPFKAPGKVGTGQGLELHNKTGFIRINDAGEIELDGVTSHVAKYEEMNIALQAQILQINANLTLIATAITNLGGTYVPVPVLQDFSTAMSTKVKLI